MGWVWLDLDDEVLQAAARELGTSSTADTVNQALCIVAERSRRLAFLDHMAAGDDDLEDADVMGGAWA